MSGIVGSKLNIRGSGLVGSLGTDGQHLLSAGAGKTNVFETAAGGGNLIKLAAQTISTDTAYFDFTSVFDSDHKYYKLYGDDIEMDAYTHWQVSFLVGGTLQTGTYYGKHVAIIGTDASSSGQDAYESATTGFRPIGNWGHATGQNQNCSLEMTFYNPNNSGTYNRVHWQSNARQSSGSNTAIYIYGQGYYGAGIAATGIRVAATSGDNMETGTFSLYGLKE